MRQAGRGIRAGSFFGFPIFITESVLYLAPTVALFILLSGSSNGLLRGLIQLPIIFASVVVHELAHALTARALGVPVRHIALTWFGGYAAFWVAPTRWREAVIALAGPASNLALSALLFALMALLPAWSNIELRGVDLYISPNREEPLASYALKLAAYVNLSFGIFNLLPALPLDGGHILRTVLATRMSSGRAHWLAAWCGVILGALVIAWAIWIESVWTLAIGLLVATVAWSERRAAREL